MTDRIVELHAHYYLVHTYFETLTPRAVAIEICAGGIRKHVHLPDELDTLYLVATEKPSCNSFDIVPQTSLTGVRIVDVHQYLLFGFRNWLQDQYDAGRKHFHFEY